MEIEKLVIERIERHGVLSTLVWGVGGAAFLLSLLFGFTVGASSAPYIATVSVMFLAAVMTLSMKSKLDETAKQLDEVVAELEKLKVERGDVGDRSDLLLNKAEQRISTYAKLLKDHLEYDFRISSWREEQRVRRNGDTWVCRTVEIKVGSQSMPIIWSALESKYPVPTGARRNVKISARLMVESTSGFRAGPALDVTPYWLSDSKLFIFAHFSNPSPAESRSFYQFEWEWSGCSPLGKGEEDDYFAIVRRPCDLFSQKIVIEAGVVADGQVITASAFEADALQPVVELTDAMEWVISYEIPNPQIDVQFGYRAGLAEYQAN